MQNIRSKETLNTKHLGDIWSRGTCDPPKNLCSEQMEKTQSFHPTCSAGCNRIKALKGSEEIAFDVSKDLRFLLETKRSAFKLE